MANDYQINLTVKAISKFSDIEKQFKKSLNSLSKVAENTSKTLDKQTQKAFNSRIKQLKDLNDVEINGVKKKNKLSENLLKNQNLNQAIQNSILKTKSNLELGIIEKKSKALDKKNKEELISLQKKNKLIENLLANKNLNQIISNNLLKAKSIVDAKKNALDIDKKVLQVKGEELSVEKKGLEIIKTQGQINNQEIRKKYFEKQKYIRSLYAESRLYSEIGKTGFYFGTLPALGGSVLSLKNAMTLENERRSLSLYSPRSEVEKYDKLVSKISAETSLDLPSSYSLAKSILTSAKDSGIMNFAQAEKKIKTLSTVFSAYGTGREGTATLLEQYRQGVTRGYFLPTQDISIMSSAGLSILRKVYKEIFGKPIKGRIRVDEMDKVLEKIASRPDVQKAYLERQKELSGATDKLSTNILITSGFFGKFLDNTYSVSNNMDIISDILEKIADRFRRLFSGEGNLGDKAMGSSIKLGLTALLVPIGMIAIGFIKRMYANYLASFFTKSAFKSNLYLAGIPLLLDFKAFTKVVEDFNNGGLLNALASNIGTLGTSLILLFNPIGRLILLFKGLYELITNEKIQNWLEEKVFKSEIGGQATSMLGENSVKYLVKKWQLPEGTTKYDKAFQDRYFQENKDISNPFSSNLINSIAEATKKGVKEGMKESSEDVYSKTGKRVETVDEKKGRPNPLDDPAFFRYLRL